MTPIEESLHEALHAVGETFPAGALAPPPAAPGRRLPWRIAVTVTAMAAATAGAVLFGRAALTPDEPSVTAGPGPLIAVGGWDVSVYLCSANSSNPSCGHRAVTPERVQALMTSAAGLKGVKDVHFESEADAFARFRRLFSSSPDVRVGDVPSSIRITLESPRYAGQVVRALASAPGIDRMVDERALGGPPTTLPPSGTPMPMGRP
ncbi:permease-like cell division protein FtsX [Actinocorallia longicatena]|uniref:FtsX extracellular domain-containing protein n=1 Tax=Actinocorallia longicatena TaxID=111803 RepID=A0ABP6QMV4_9ACTN